MYQVSYRKWRPQLFDDVVGQSHVTQTLQSELDSNRIGHAYLFIGSRGTGKTSCSKIFAKAVNCTSPVNGNPCNECEMCRKIESGSVTDIVEMDAASNNGVADIRTLCEEVQFTPAIAKYRVYIIDEVHMLSQGAFNALLKTLEEPPSHVIFILATTEAHKIPATILSRCQRFEFHRINVENICERLRFIANSEGGAIDKEASRLLARVADGSMRDALSLFDTCFGEDPHITYSLVTNVIGLASRDCLVEMSEAIIKKDAADVIRVIDRLNRDSKDMAYVCDEFIEYLRMMMLTLTMANPREIITLSDDEFSEMQGLAVRFSLDRVVNTIDALSNSREKMARGCNKRVELEVTLIRLCLPRELDIELLLKRVEKLESLFASSTIAPQKKITMNAGMNVSSQPVSASDMLYNIDDLVKGATPFEKWPEVLTTLQRYSATLSAAFMGSVAYTNGNFMLIHAPQEMAFELLKKSTQRDKMRAAINEVTGKAYKLGPYKKPVAISQENKPDPLVELINTAKQAGINVKVNGEQYQKKEEDS